MRKKEKGYWSRNKFIEITVEAILIVFGIFLTGYFMEIQKEKEKIQLGKDLLKEVRDEIWQNKEKAESYLNRVIVNGKKYVAMLNDSTEQEFDFAYPILSQTSWDRVKTIDAINTIDKKLLHNLSALYGMQKDLMDFTYIYLRVSSISANILTGRKSNPSNEWMYIREKQYRENIARKVENLIKNHYKEVLKSL